MSTSRKPGTSGPVLEPDWEPAGAAGGANGKPDPARTVMMSGMPAQALAVRGGAADAIFLVCMGPNVGHRYSLFDRTTLGRSEACDITLADDRVSGRHCEVVKSPRGGFVVRDLGSSNGTLVNAQKITEMELHEGDLVQVGFTVFKFQGSGVGGRVERMPQDPHVYPGGMGGMPMGPGMGGMPMAGMPMGGMPMGGMGMGGMPMGGMPMGGMGMPSTVIVGAASAAAAPEQEMNLEEMVGNVRKVVEFFLPHNKLIIACSLFGIVLGGVLAVALPPSAKATFEMNISTGSDGKSAIFADRAQAAASNFKSTVLIERTLKGLAQSDTSPERIAVIQRNLAFGSTTPNYGMPPPVQNFVGEFQASSEENALMFLSTHVRTFIDSEVEKTTRVLLTKLEFLREKIGEAETKLRTSDEELKEFKKKYLASLPENAAKSQEFLFELQKTEGELSSGIEGLKLEIASASTGGTSKKSKLLQQVKDEIAELKAQGLGDNHPDVRAARAKLARVEASADEGRTGSGRSGDKSIGQLKAELSSKTLQLEQVRRQLEDVRKAVASLPDFEARYAELTRSYDSSKKNYEGLMQERDLLEYQLGFEKTAAEARFEVVRPPIVEKQSPVKAYGKKAVMGIVAGVGLGFALAAFLQLLKIWRRS